MTEESYSNPDHRIFQVDAIKDRSDQRASTLNINLEAQPTQQLPSPQIPLAIPGPSDNKNQSDKEQPTDQTTELSLLQVCEPQVHLSQ